MFTAILPLNFQCWRLVQRDLNGAGQAAQFNGFVQSPDSLLKPVEFTFRNERGHFMTSPIRAAVIASPDYPFKPIDAKIKLDQNESSDDFPEDLKAQVQQRLMDIPWNRYPDLNAETNSISSSNAVCWRAVKTATMALTDASGSL